MELVAEIITACMNELGELGVNDWFPDDNQPETFFAECEIEHTDRNFPMAVKLCGYIMWLWERDGHMEVYASIEDSHIEWRAA